VHFVGVLNSEQFTSSTTRDIELVEISNAVDTFDRVLMWWRCQVCYHNMAEVTRINLSHAVRSA
jgi:hypothetical protein